MGDLEENVLFFQGLNTYQVHKCLVVSTGIRLSCWEHWLLQVKEHLGSLLWLLRCEDHLKHLLVVKEVVEVPLGDGPEVQVGHGEEKELPKSEEVPKHVLALQGKQLIESHLALIPGEQRVGLGVPVVALSCLHPAILRTEHNSAAFLS